ncbi:MAG: hypothetical protein FJ317_02605 [SAR202 cluster bacterium]|nr:hypothetical protein [SAR202 cluster bacterium]
MANPLVIDVHVHFYASRREGRESVDPYVGWEFGKHPTPAFSKYDGVVDDVLANNKESGASKAFMVHFYLPFIDRYNHLKKLGLKPTDAAGRRAIEEFSDMHRQNLKRSNYWACEVLKPHPQLFPYVFIDPWAFTPQEAADHMTDLAKNHGARGIKLHAPIQMFEMGDKRMWPTYEVCRDMGLGIVAHSGTSEGPVQYGDPRAFVPVYKSFPTLKLVTAHLGNGSWKQTRDVARENPNAMFDTCELIEWFGAPLGPTAREFAQLIKDIGPHRVLLASDFPWWSTKHVADIIMGLPVLSRQEKEGILGANAARYFGF